MSENGAITALGVVGAWALVMEHYRRRNVMTREVQLDRKRESLDHGTQEWTQIATLQRKGGVWKEVGERRRKGGGQLPRRRGSSNESDQEKLLRLLGYSEREIKRKVGQKKRQKQYSPLGFKWPTKGSASQTGYKLTSTSQPPKKGKWTLIIHRRKGKVTEWFLQEPNGTGGGVDTTASPSIPAVLHDAQKHWKRKIKKIPSTLRVMVIDNVSSDTWKEFSVNTKTLSQVPT